MSLFTFTIYDTPLSGGGGTFTFGAGVPQGTLTVEDNIDMTFNDNSGNLFTAPEPIHVPDPKVQATRLFLQIHLIQRQMAKW